MRIAYLIGASQCRLLFLEQSGFLYRRSFFMFCWCCSVGHPAGANLRFRKVMGRYGYGGPDDYELPRRHSISQSRTDYFYPEVVVRFDPSTGDLEFESISLGTQSVHVGIDDVEGHLRRWKA
jgi:hypothetical protein